MIFNKLPRILKYYAPPYKISSRWRPVAQEMSTLYICVKLAQLSSHCTTHIKKLRVTQLYDISQVKNTKLGALPCNINICF